MFVLSCGWCFFFPDRVLRGRLGDIVRENSLVMLETLLSLIDAQPLPLGSMTFASD